MDMTEKEREEIFFLKANDLYFRPNLNPVGKSLITRLESRNGLTKLTDIKLGRK